MIPTGKYCINYNGESIKHCSKAHNYEACKKYNVNLEMVWFKNKRNAQLLKCKQCLESEKKRKCSLTGDTCINPKYSGIECYTKECINTKELAICLNK